MFFLKKRVWRWQNLMCLFCFNHIKWVSRNKVSPFKDPRSARINVSVPRLCDVFKTAVIKTAVGPAVEKADKPLKEKTFTEWLIMSDTALAKKKENSTTFHFKTFETSLRWWSRTFYMILSASFLLTHPARNAAFETLQSRTLTYSGSRVCFIQVMFILPLCKFAVLVTSDVQFWKWISALDGFEDDIEYERRCR